jgi:ribosome-binding protein aMBF1 (putative translation factor)
MCAEERLQTVFRGDMSCDHCGRKLTRYVRVLVHGQVLQVGTTCALKLFDEGAVEAPSDP